MNEDKTGEEGPLELEMPKVRTRAVISGLARRHPAILGWRSATGWVGGPGAMYRGARSRTWSCRSRWRIWGEAKINRGSR